MIQRFYKKFRNMLKTNNNIIGMKLTMPLMNAEIGFTMEDSLE